MNRCRLLVLLILLVPSAITLNAQPPVTLSPLTRKVHSGEFVVEGDALDQAGDFLGARLVKTCGIRLVGYSFSHGWFVLR
jgi:hypothetical protein